LNRFSYIERTNHHPFNSLSFTHHGLPARLTLHAIKRRHAQGRQQIMFPDLSPTTFFHSIHNRLVRPRLLNSVTSSYRIGLLENMFDMNPTLDS
jgi:hypothetical protein